MSTARSRSNPDSRAADSKQVPLYEQLKQAIFTGTYAPGQPLVELTLAREYGVSRTPVREALGRLEHDGLVERDSHGVAVRNRSPEEILDLYDTRIILESAAGGVAAERRTEHDLRQLMWNLNYGGEVSVDDSPALVDANMQFHRAVWRSTHNESMVDLLERLNLHLARYPGTTLSYEGRWETALAEHNQLFEAIERRDADAAREISHRHFSEARDIRLALFAEEHRGQAR